MIRHRRRTFVDQLTSYHGFALDIREVGVGGKGGGDDRRRMEEVRKDGLVMMGQGNFFGGGMRK